MRDENLEIIPGDQLQLILNELDTDYPVAVKGNNIFPMTYQLLANVIMLFTQLLIKIHFCIRSYFRLKYNLFSLSI